MGPDPCIEMSAQKAYKRCLAVSTQDFSTLSRATRRFWQACHALACGGVGVEGFPFGEGEVVGAIGGERGATVQNESMRERGPRRLVTRLQRRPK